MSSIGDLVAHLRVDSTKWKPSLDKASGQSRSFASGLSSNFVGITAGFAAVTGAVYAMTASFNAAREAAKIAAKFEAVITATGNAAGLTSEEYEKLAKSIHKTTDFDDDAATDAMATLAKFGTISGEQFKKALPLAADLAAVMGTDLSSAAQTLGRALNDPEQGMTALEKAVGKFNTTQREAIKGFVDAGDKASAQGAIIEALAGKVGGSAEAMSDPFTRLENSVGNVFESIGNNLIAFTNPFLELGLTEEVDTFAESLEKLIPLSERIGEDMADSFRGIIPAMQEVSAFVRDVGERWDKIAPALKYASENNTANMLLNPASSMERVINAATDPGSAGEILESTPNRLNPALKKLEDEGKAAIKAREELDKMFEEWDAVPLIKRKRPQRPEMEPDGTPKDYGLDEVYRLGSTEPQNPAIRGDSRSRFAGALEQGSAAAYSAIVEASGQGQDDKIAKEQLSVAKEQLKELKRKGVTQGEVPIYVGSIV